MKPTFSSYHNNQRNQQYSTKPSPPTRRTLQEVNANINPFSRNNNNYPGLDHVFEKELSSPFSPDRASSIISPASELNMSIGARAAINEHARYVAKFGLDGSSSSRYDSSSQHNDYSPNKDDEWERLMNGTSISHASFSSTFIVENAKNQTTLNVTNCDQSSDFFNSSRVAMLATPDKNKVKVDEASRLARTEGVGLPNERGAVHRSHDSESISGSTDASHDIDQSGMVGLFNAAMRLGDRINNMEESMIHVCPEEEESLVSYQDPNLSLISNHDIKIASNEKAPSDFLQSDLHHDYQESSFISYHEPELSIISNRHDPDLSALPVMNEMHALKPSYEADEDYVDDVIEVDKFLVRNKNEFHHLEELSQTNDVSIHEADDTSNGNTLLHSPPKRKKSCEGEWDSIQSKHENEFGAISQTGTASDFNNAFLHLEDYTTFVENEDALVHENDKTDWSPRRNDSKQKYPSWDDVITAENSKDISKIALGYSGYNSKDWSDNRIRVPSPEKSEFNVDVSEIWTASECGSRFSRARSDYGYHPQSQVAALHFNSFNCSEDKINHGTSHAISKDRALVASNRVAIGFSPISGDSPSEFDNGTFKSSLPSSSSSTLSKRQNYYDHALDQNVSKNQTTKLAHSSSIPHISRLRERYSRPDRFEDSYVVATFHDSSSNFRIDNDTEDNSTSRSLLDTFEHATIPESGRRFEV